MTDRRALFRCDAGATLGGGHVMRCLTLADAMAEAGWTCDFAVSPATLGIVEGARFGAHGLKVLGDPLDPAMTPDGYDLAIVDHYELDAAYETGLRHAAPYVAVLDDRPNRPHDCDLLLDQNHGRNAAAYEGLIPSGARRLCGTDYALLRPEFPALRQEALARRRTGGAESGLRVLVSLGLTDVGGVTGRIMKRLLATPAVAAAARGEAGADLGFDVVIGPAAPSREQLSALAASRDDVTLHVATDDMAALMTRADVCIGAGGTTSWERCCLGLPTVLIVLADNQRDIAASLAGAGAAVSLNDGDSDEDTGAVETALMHLLRDDCARAAMAGAASGLCDGGGAARAAAEMTALVAGSTFAGSGGLSDEGYRARDAGPGDCADLWLWRTHPRARAVSLNSGHIAWASHRDWFTASLASADRVMLMVERAGHSVGYVRFDRCEDANGDTNGRASGDTWLVSVALAPRQYGRGVGRDALATGIAAMRARGHTRFRADIQQRNEAARRIFVACGFARRGPGAAGFDEYELNEGEA